MTTLFPDPGQPDAPQGPVNQFTPPPQAKPQFQPPGQFQARGQFQPPGQFEPHGQFQPTPYFAPPSPFGQPSGQQPPYASGPRRWRGRVFALVTVLVLAVGGGTAFWIIHNRSENGGLDAGAGIEPAEVTEASSWCDQVFGPHVVVTDSDGERWDMQAGAILPNAAELGPEEGLADPLKDKAEAVRALGGALEAIRMAADLERDEAGMAATFEAYEDKTNEVVEWAQDVLLHGSRAKVPKNGWYDEQMALIYWCYQDGYEFQTGKP